MEDFFSHLIAFKKVFSYTPTKKWYPSSRIEPGCEVVEVITGGRYHYGDKVFQRGTILWHIADECLLNGATDTEQPYSCLSFVFQVKEKKRLFPLISMWNEIHPHEIEEFFLEAQALQEKTDINLNFLSVYLYSRLARQTMNMDILEKQTQTRYSPTMRKILKMLANADSLTVSLAEIARVTSRSESCISHLFRREMGVTPHQYLLRQKIKAARALLNGPLPVKVIAERCGFPKLRTFYAAFRRETGISPGTLRNRRAFPDMGKTVL